MTHAKSDGQVRTGLEVFSQAGRYGVMRNGRVTCPPRFKEVRPLQAGCGFFALAVYLTRNGQNFGHLEEVTTVIDRYGRDLNVVLRGDVSWRDGYFYGELVGRDFVRSSSWDPVGNSYYDGEPCFTKVAGVEVGFAREHGSTVRTCMKLRRSTGLVSPRFHIEEMFYNRDIIIARDYLVVKNDGNHSYRIRGYLGDSVLVECEERHGCQQVMPDGSKGAFYAKLPAEATRILDAVRLGLQRAHK